jgi:ketosteroid isomerase-like protein
MQASNKESVERLLAGINGGNVSVMDEVFHNDALMDWPQFGERIRGAENRRNVYANIPVLPKVAPRRIFGAGDLWIAEAVLDYDGSKFNVILVFEFRDGRIERETAYWATPSEPAPWRASWVELLD